MAFFHSQNAIVCYHFVVLSGDEQMMVATLEGLAAS